MLESELAKAKAKIKVIGVFKIDLDNKKYEMNMIDKKLNKEKANAKYLEKKNGLLKCHNQMINTNNNQLNRNNMLLLENMRNMDEQIDRVSVYAQRICHNARYVGRDAYRYQQSMAKTDVFF
jgi:aspartate carbamoyltransferase regulatory subunit